MPLSSLLCSGTANAHEAETRHLRPIDRPVLTSTADDAIADVCIDAGIKTAMSLPSLNFFSDEDEDDAKDAQHAAKGVVVGFSATTTTIPAIIHVHEEVKDGTDVLGDTGSVENASGGYVIAMPWQQQRWLTAHNRRRRHTTRRYVSCTCGYGGACRSPSEPNRTTKHSSNRSVRTPSLGMWEKIWPGTAERLHRVPTVC
jgi:hypothetical protein